MILTFEPRNSILGVSLVIVVSCFSQKRSRNYGYRKNEAGPTSGEKDDSYNPLDLTGGGGGGAIFDNFISAVRNGDRSELTCDIETGHMSTVLPLIANISYKMGRELKLDVKQESFINDKEANKLLTKSKKV